MSKLLLLFSVVLLCSMAPAQEQQIVTEQSAKVYICTGNSSKRYHKTSRCKGLRRCSGEIRKVTVDEAKSLGRTPCKICY